MGESDQEDERRPVLLTVPQSAEDFVFSANFFRPLTRRGLINVGWRFHLESRVASGGFALLNVRHVRCPLSSVGSRATSGHRVNLTAYGAGGMTEYTAFRSARSRGSPVSAVPIWLVTYA